MPNNKSLNGGNTVTINWVTNASLESFESIWRGLESRCADISIFQTYEWVSTWWARYKKSSDRLLIGVLKEGDTVEAVFPYFIKTRLTPLGYLKIAQFLGIEEVGPSSMDILATKRACDLLLSDASELTSDWQKHADLLDLAPVRLGGALFKLLCQDAKASNRTYQSAVENAPVLTAPGSFALWLASLGSSTRRDIRRKRGYLASQENVKITHYNQPEDVTRGLKTLAQLNIKRLTQLGKRGGFMLPRFDNFHQTFAAQLAAQNRAHLFELTHGEQVICAAIVYSIGKTWYAYQTGMDPKYLDLAPGAVLDSHVLEYIFDKTDATHVDMGLGHQDYKLRFGGIPQKAYRLRIPAQSWRGSLLKILLCARGQTPLGAKVKASRGALLPCN